MDIARREQSGGSNRRDYITSWPNLRDESADDDVQEISKRDHEPKSTKPIWSDPPIPKKKNLKQFGRKEAYQEKESNYKRNPDDTMTNSIYSIVSSPNDKCNASRENVESTVVDLCCSDGETDAEDVDAGQLKYGASSRSIDKSKKIDQPAEQVSHKAIKGDNKITQTLATINGDEVFVPQKPLGLFKAPSSSEGRKITKADKTTNLERKSPMRIAIDRLTKPLPKRKKSGSAGHPIFPGASLQPNKLQIRSDRLLEPSNTSNQRGASLEPSKSFATPSKRKALVRVDSSEDDCDYQSKRSSDKPAAKKTSNSYDEDFSYDDFSSANSVAKKRKNGSSREQDTPSPLFYRTTRSSARKSYLKRKTNEVVDMLDDSDDEEVSHVNGRMSQSFVLSPRISFVPEHLGVL